MNKSSLIKGAVTGGLQSVIQILLVFSAIPVFIKLLGSEAYGIFGLTTAIGNLNIFTNLGLSASIVKHISEQGKCKESDFDILVSVLILSVVLLFVCGIVILFNEFIILDIMNIPPDKYISSKWLFISIACGNSLLVLGQLFKAVLDSCGKVYLSNYLQMFYNISYWGTIIIVLLLGYNLTGVGIAIFSADLIWFVLIAFNALRTWGIPTGKGIKSNFTRVAKKQLSYGGKIFSGGLVSFFYEPLLRLLISNFIGINEVGYFDIGIRIKNQLWGIVSRILYPLFPFIAQINDKKKLAFLIKNIEQKILFIAVPFIVLFCFTIRPFVNMWIGNNTLIISQTAAVIVSAFLIGSCCIIPFYYFLLSKNHPEKTIVLQSANALASLCFFILTFKWAGYYAALIGSAGGILSSFTISLYYQRKYLHIKFITYNDLLKLIAICIINICLCYLAYISITGNLVKLLVIPLVVCFTTLILFNRFNVFSEEDFNRYIGDSVILSKYCVKFFCKAKGVK